MKKIVEIVRLAESRAYEIMLFENKEFPEIIERLNEMNKFKQDKFRDALETYRKTKGEGTGLVDSILGR